MEENFENLKIMVIDDSKTIRRTAETLLKKVGCTVITATDGFDVAVEDTQTHIFNNRGYCQLVYPERDILLGIIGDRKIIYIT